jgi:NADPH:quinone reductase-like Zn-dependent oxidoreductase
VIVMFAIVIRKPGGPEALEWAEVDDPVVGAEQVILDVVASGVNRADTMQRRGLYPPPQGVVPYPGLEVSGRISELGPGVRGWQVGDEVCALLAGGGYAERVVIPAGQLLPIPRGVGLVEAAGLPEVVCTVWSNVFMRARLTAGETFLVHGGGSGIGTMAIQLATRWVRECCVRWEAQKRRRAAGSWARTSPSIITKKTSSRRRPSTSSSTTWGRSTCRGTYRPWQPAAASR